MNPFLSSGIRAAMRRRHDGPRNRPPMWALLWDEFRDLVRRVARSPVARVWLLAALVAAALVIGLSDTTPGPVVAEWLRLSAVATVVALAAVTVAAAAERWGRARPGARAVLGWLTVGSVAVYVGIGLHQETPGPVLEPALRWTLTGLLLAGAGAWHRRARRGR